MGERERGEDGGEGTDRRRLCSSCWFFEDGGDESIGVTVTRRTAFPALPAEAQLSPTGIRRGSFPGDRPTDSRSHGRSHTLHYLS